MNDIYLGAVYDAMRLIGYNDGQFYINIKPKAGYKGIISGPALTTCGRLVSKNEDYDKLDNIRLNIYKKELFKEKPIVLLQANDDYCAHSGDITSNIYQSLGAKGFITDGNVRDIEKIEEISFPVFCESINPIDALDYWALTEYNNPIVIKNVEISPGDFIYASQDGVIRVKRADHSIFLKNLENILKKENDARKLIKNIKGEDFTAEFNKFVTTYGRW